MKLFKNSGFLCSIFGHRWDNGNYRKTCRRVGCPACKTVTQRKSIQLANA